MKRTHKGFTLVELLIIIAVIGILAATMMIGGKDAVASANASNIISNMRNLKTAAISLYYDKMDNWNTAGTPDETSPVAAVGPTIAQVKAYLDSANEITDAQDEGGEYNIAFSTVTDTTTPYAERAWFITYTFPTSGTGSANAPLVKSRIAGRAKSVGLSGSTGAQVAPAFDKDGDDDLTTYAAYSNEATVCLKVR